MIFVTVGTHEQPFDRLAEAVDDLARTLDEEVVIQTGYCTYVPKYCTYSKFYPYSRMLELVEQARIVVTHGGPSSFIMPLQVGKTPIVVPRQEKYGEHVNDHQLEFALQVQQRQKNILVVTDVAELPAYIDHYEDYAAQTANGVASNNEAFVERFAQIAKTLVEG